MTPDQLHDILHYDPDTGSFEWTKIRKGVSRVGQPAGSVFVHPHTGHRYLIISALGKRYRAHNLAYFYMTGQWPKGIIDHKDGDGLNNKWANLRDATKSQNHANSKRMKNNTTGAKGVKFDRGKFNARICVNKKRIDLGRFDTLEEARLAYQKAAVQYFGPFARFS